MSIGATRNLTEKFKKLRTNAQAGRRPSFHVQEDKATAKLIDAALNGASGDVEGGFVGVVGAVTPDWVVQSEKIKTEMGILKDRLNKLKEWHSKAMLVSFETENEAQQHVDVLTEDVKQMFGKLDKEIKRLSASAGGGDGKVVAQVQRQLAQALFKLSVEFRKQETRYLNKLEERKGYGRGHFGLLVEEAGVSSAMDEDPGFTDLQLAQVSQAESMVAQRDEEIRKIVETIAELAQIMKDLSVLVVEQGTILDRIDYNIEQVAQQVEAGVSELEKAEKKQKASRSILCIAALIVCILIVLLVIVYRVS